MALQLRRGTNAQRLAMTPANGELIFVTDYELETASVTSIDISTDTLTTTAAHGLTVNQQVKYIGATLNGLTADQVYFVKTAPSITTFTLSTTLGGGTLNITGTFTVALVFAKTPTLASGAPVGTGVSPLWIGDGATVGGVFATSLNLDDLLDVEITSVAEGNTLYYDATTNFWRNTDIVTVDDVNSRVGVNNPTPNFTLDVGGTAYIGDDLFVAGADIFTGADNVRLQANRTVASGDPQNGFKKTLLLKSISAGTPAVGYGPALGFVGQTTATSSGNFEEAGSIAVMATDLTPTTEAFKMTFNLMNAGTADVERMVLDSLGNLQIDGDLTVTGNEIKSSSATALTLSGTDVAVAGNLTVTGNNIKSSSATAITLSGDDVTVQGDLGVAGGTIATGAATGNLFNTTATTINAFGAATQVNIGINGAGAVDILPTTDSTSQTTGALQVAGGVGIVKNLHVGGTISVDNANNATTATTGSIQTDGGIGVVKDIFVGGAGYIGGNTTLNNGTVLTNSGNVFLFNTVATTVDAFEAATTINIGAATGTTTIQHNLKVASVISNDDTRNATNTTDGSIQTDGGVSVAKDIFVGGLATITGDVAVNGGDLTTTAATGNLFNTTATTVNIGGAATTMSIGNGAGTVTIPGNLTVNGTTTTINSQTLLVEDKNITIGDVAVPTDVTASGGGITLLGATDKTITWNNATDGWEFNQPIKVTGDIVTSGDIAVNGGDVTTTSATGTLFNTTATTVNIAGAGTTVSIGANTGTTTVNNNLVADALTVSGDIAVNGGDITTTAATASVFNTTATTLNIGGAATTVAIGAATGTTTIGNDLVVNGNATLGSNQSDTVTVNGLVTDNIIFSFNDTATPRGILGQMSTSAVDYWFVGGAENSGTSNDGYAMIATGDDGNDEIYVRQYNGSPLSGTVNRELTLLDGSGNTLIPGNLSTNGDLFVENNKNLYVSGQSLVLNNNDTAGGNVELVSYRGVGGASSTSIRWNETTDRWQTTVDGSTFLNIPNQNLDTTDSVAFGAVAIDARADIDTSTLTTTATTQVPLATSTRNVMKCVVYIVQGTDVHTVEALVLRTGAATALVTTYGEMYNTSALATFAADTSGGAIRLLVTPANTTSMLFTSVITSLT